MTPDPASRRDWRRWLLAATTVALVLALLALIGGTARFANHSRLADIESARQTELDYHIQQIQAILVALADAETGQRGYLLTGRQHYLAPYKHALALLPQLLEGLKGIPVEPSKIRSQVETIRTFSNLKLEELGRTVELQDTGQHDVALALVMTDRGQQYMDETRAALQGTMDILRTDRGAALHRLSETESQLRRWAVAIVSAIVACVLLAGAQLLMLGAAQRRFAAALADSEKRHRSILEEQRELVSLAREDGTIVYVNPAYARHFGKRPEEMVGRKLLDFVNADDRAAVAALLRGVFRSGVTAHGENRMAAPDAADAWIAWTNSLHQEPDGERLLHSVGRDVTERRRLQDQLAERERFMREITDNLPVRISYVDRTGRYRFVNSVQCHRFGKPREEILGRTREELMGREMDPGQKAPAVAAFAGRAQRVEFEERVQGEPRTIQSQLIPDVGPDGEVRGLYVTGVDITALKEAERQLRDINEILEHSPDFVMQTNWKGEILYVNPAARRALGFSDDERLEGRPFTEFNTPQTNARFASEITEAARSDGAWLGETTVLLAQQAVTPVSHLVIAHRDLQGRVVRYSAVMRDISRETADRLALRRQTATLAAVVEAIPAVVAVQDAGLRYRLVNRSFERWVGKDRSEIVGRKLVELFGQADHDRSWPWLRRALGGESVQFEKDYADGARRRVLSVSYMPLRLEDGTIDGLVAMAHDITVHREEERRLLTLSERDALTGALNRAGFNSYLDQRCAAGGAAQLGLLYIDLDRFKPVNDTHGHPVGDALLQQFARRMQELVRPTDAVARLGGDEFAIVLDGVQALANAQAVADKVVEAAGTPFQVGELSLSIGASVGVAYGADGDEGWKGLVARADALVYQAKAAGRGWRA